MRFQICTRHGVLPQHYMTLVESYLTSGWEVEIVNHARDPWMQGYTGMEIVDAVLHDLSGHMELSRLDERPPWIRKRPIT